MLQISQLSFFFQRKRNLLKLLQANNINSQQSDPQRMNPFYFIPSYPFYPYPYGTFSPSLFSTLPSTISPPQIQKCPNIPITTPVKQQVLLSGSRESSKKRRRKSTEEIPLLMNRNILPNMTNVVLSYVRRINKSGHRVKRAMEELTGEEGFGNPEMLKKFYAYQNYIKNNVNDYIIRDAIKVVMKYQNPDIPIFSVEDQRFFNSVFRIVVRNYLVHDYLLDILSQKMPREKRCDHLKVRTYLLSLFRKTSK